MLSVRGIYNGKSVKITDKISEKKKYRVVVTFIEELNEPEEDYQNISAQTKGLDFWEDTREDLYQDYLLAKNKS